MCDPHFQHYVFMSVIFSSNKNLKLKKKVLCLVISLVYYNHINLRSDKNLLNLETEIVNLTLTDLAFKGGPGSN